MNKYWIVLSNAKKFQHKYAEILLYRQLQTSQILLLLLQLMIKCKKSMSVQKITIIMFNAFKIQKIIVFHHQKTMLNVKYNAFNNCRMVQPNKFICAILIVPGLWCNNPLLNEMEIWCMPNKRKYNQENLLDIRNLSFEF